jgi:hypothetical protein
MQNCILNPEEKRPLEYMCRENRVLQQTLNKKYGGAWAKFSLDPGKAYTIL